MNKQELTIIEENEIKNRIHNIRGIQVIIDYDLAELYGVETKQLNRAVKRNIERFPKEFMFQLNDFEYKSLRFQFGTLKTGRGKHRKYLPYVFTEQGVAMLSAVLNSETAVKVSVQIMGAFVAMRRFLINNAQLFQRLDKTEQKLLEHDNKFEQVFNLIESKEIKPEKGIFFDGQIFDAHKLFSDIIRTANTSIILIDNYIDDSVLTLFSKRKKSVKVTIFTKEISKQLSLDLEKYNSQYPQIKIKEFKQAHDRFMILDNKEVYHFGASLKDLGKKWFAFSKFDKEVFTLLNKLK
ncbi:ORF6N domain-containing protein [Candidatus Woesearchaeota archaeon]|nr:ORF6N domain-containing protein [Candidatus Woesearchaeota archaeon]